MAKSYSIDYDNVATLEEFKMLMKAMRLTVAYPIPEEISEDEVMDLQVKSILTPREEGYGSIQES